MTVAQDKYDLYGTQKRRGIAAANRLARRLVELRLVPDDRVAIIAQRRDGFQRHVTSALDRPFIVLFEQDRTDEG